MDDFDFLEPSPDQLQQARVNALKQKGLALQQGGLGALMSGTGDTALGQEGTHMSAGSNQLMADAQHQEQMLQGAQDRALNRQQTADYHQGLLAMRDAALSRSKSVIGKDGSRYTFNPRSGAWEQVGGPTAAPGAGGGGMGPEDPATLDVEAENLASGNGFILNGKGKDALAHNQKVLRRAVQLHSGLNPALAHANYGADTKSLGHVQQQADAVNSFTRTFDKNVDVLESSLASLPSSDLPLINKGYRAWQEGKGSPQLTAFRNALNTVRSELGKINSGSTGAGGVPISVLQEMEHGLPENATPAQVLGALKIYRKDSENRRAAMDEQLQEIRGRIGGKPKAAPANTEPHQQPSAEDAHAAIRARISELKAQGLDKGAIKAQLLKEGLGGQS